MIIIYFLIAFISTTIGAISGIGGGVIIKPVLDTLGHYEVATIGLLSSITVLSMAVVSTIKHYVSGIRFEGRKTIYLSFGSVLGGISGKIIFSTLCDSIRNKDLITAYQSFILGLLLIFVLIFLMKKNIRNFNIQNRFIIFIAGLILGFIASFLGVGGGPFNVVLLIFLFSMDAKSAAVHSVLIILFSQSAKLITVLFDIGFSPYDLSMLLYMIPGGVAGGFLGSSLNKRLDSKTIQLLFKIVISSVICLNIYNMVKSLI